MRIDNFNEIVEKIKIHRPKNIHINLKLVPGPKHMYWLYNGETCSKARSRKTEKVHFKVISEFILIMVTIKTTKHDLGYSTFIFNLLKQDSILDIQD